MKRIVRVKGIEIKVFAKSIVTSGVSIFYNRPVENIDVRNIEHIIRSAYQDGMNYSQQRIKKSFEAFMETINER